jgi:subtilase-type serine protease
VAREYKTEEGVRVTPEIRGRWTHEFLNDDRMINARFVGSTAGSFRVEGDRPARNKAVLGAGLTILTKENLGLSMHYNADLGSNDTAHALTARLQYTW